jgi:hypothetical protein
MECHEARLLIDERVHGSLNADLSTQLDGHLKNCPDCREDLRQLEKMRELLALTRRDTPSPKTLHDIWQAVAQATAESTPVNDEGDTDMTSAASTSYANPPLRSVSAQQKRTHWKLVAASTLVAAAVVVVSFVVGQAEFGRKQSLVATANAPAQPPAAQAHGMYWTEQPRSQASEETGIAVAPSEDLKKAEMDYEASNPDQSVGSMSGKTAGGRKMMVMHHGGSAVTTEAPPPPATPPSAPAPIATPDPNIAVIQSGPLSVYDGESQSAQQGEFKLTQPKSDAPAERSKEESGKDNIRSSKNDKIAAEPSKQKIIKTGELTVEVKNFVEAERAVDALVVKFNGILADSRTYDMPGATKRGEIVVRVAPEKFEEMFAELKKLGTVLAERAGGQDITAQYTDMEARIKNLQIAEARLQELIKEKTFMDKISSLLEVERELSRVRGEIESMQGTMRVWNDQISLSTIRLTLQEPSRAVPSGSLSVEVPNLADAKKTLDAALTNAGGHLLSGQITKRSDGTLMGTYSLRVKFGRFGELAAAIKGLGRVQDEHIQNQPLAGGIPEGAQDVQADLALVLFERSIQLPNASLSLEISTMGEAMKSLDVQLAQAQATVISNQTTRQGDGTTVANITLRVRAGNFSSLVDGLPSLGRITQRTVSGEAGKVQGGAADVPVNVSLYLYEQHKQVPTGRMNVEVESFSGSTDKLRALIKQEGLQVLSSDSQQRPDGTWAASFRLGIKADKMDSVVGEIEKFGRVKDRQLQGLGLGDLSKVDPNVIGEVAVVLQEKPAIAPQEEGSFRLMLRDTFGGFLTSMGYIVRGLGMILPWAAFAALIIGLIWKFTKRTEKTPASTTAAAAAPTAVEPPKGEQPKDKSS